MWSRISEEAALDQRTASNFAWLAILALLLSEARAYALLQGRHGARTSQTPRWLK